MNYDMDELKKYFRLACNTLASSRDNIKRDTNTRKVRLGAIMSTLMQNDGILPQSKFIEPGVINGLLTSLHKSEDDKDKSLYKAYINANKTQDQLDDAEARKKEREYLGKTQAELDAEMAAERRRIDQQHNFAIDYHRQEHALELADYLKKLIEDQNSPVGKALLDKIHAENELERLQNIWNPFKDKQVSDDERNEYYRTNKDYLENFPLKYYKDTDKYGNDPAKLEAAEELLDKMKSAYSGAEGSAISDFWSSNYPELADSNYRVISPHVKDFKKKTVSDYDAELLGFGDDAKTEPIYRIRGPQTYAVWLKRNSSEGDKRPYYVIHQAARRSMDYDPVSNRLIPFDKSGKTAREFYVTDSSNNNKATDFSGLAPAMSKFLGSGEQASYDTSKDFFEHYLPGFLADTLPSQRHRVYPMFGTEESANRASAIRETEMALKLGDLDAFCKRMGLTRDEGLRRLDKLNLAVTNDDGMFIKDKAYIKGPDRMPVPERASEEELLEKHIKKNRKDKDDDGSDQLLGTEVRDGKTYNVYSADEWSKAVKEHPDELTIVGIRQVSGKTRTSDGKQAGGGFKIWEAFNKFGDAVKTAKDPDTLNAGGGEYTDYALNIMGKVSKAERKAANEIRANKRADVRSRFEEATGSAVNGEAVADAKKTLNLAKTLGKKNVGSQEGLQQAEDVVSADKALRNALNAEVNASLKGDTSTIKDIDAMLGIKSSDDDILGGILGDVNSGSTITVRKGNEEKPKAILHKKGTLSPDSVNDTVGSKLNKNVIKGIKGDSDE